MKTLEKLNESDPRKVLRNIDEQKGEIFVTKEFNKFKFHSQNRPINRVHVKSLVQSIRAEGQLTPIQVTRDFLIKDGQHRLEACKELGIPVYYFFEARESTEFDILNSIKHIQTGEPWKKEDFLISFAKTIPDYKEYLDFLTDFRINLRSGKISGNSDGGLSYVHILYFDKRLSGKLYQAFRLGEMTISPREREQAANRYEYLREIAAIHEGHWMKFFLSDRVAQVLAIFIEHPKFEKLRLLERLNESPVHSLMLASKSYDIAMQLEKLYNFKLGEASRIKISENFVYRGQL